jgi:hypothetical protein
MAGGTGLLLLLFLFFVAAQGWAGRASMVQILERREGGGRREKGEREEGEGREGRERERERERDREEREQRTVERKVEGVH